MAFYTWFLITACHEEDFNTDPGAFLRFENDTVSFDTVFSTIGSATRFIKIYNPHKQSIRIDRVYIKNGNQSDFKMNLDGISGNTIENIEIRAEDSIYMFFEVTVNPNDPVEFSPFIKTDSVFLEYNSNQQKILLLAYGQNANYIPSKSNKGGVELIDLKGSTQIWDDPRPYIVYGIIYIDNGNLIIPAGTKVYLWGGLTKAIDGNGNSFFYNDGRIIIGPNASIKVEGTKEKPVVFQGVRLEPFYQNIPGQWSGIFLDKMSRGNEFNYTEIKNNLIGIIADSLSECKIQNTIIYNNSLYGVYASSADLFMSNCLIYNQGSSSLYFTTGGNYEVNYCTVVNFGNTDPSVYLSNARCIDVPFCSEIYEYPLKSTFVNSVITGSDEDELWMMEKSTSNFEPKFQNCLFRIKDLIKEFPQFNSLYAFDCINYERFNSLFKDISNDNFHPDTLSVLEKKAIPIPGITTDLDDRTRDVLMPDIGCYEYFVK
ncbi:MAG: right-handed parallel beta-helix repeat-containing protein [Saprospiraceae bacterium]|nr:right-handed parallel beta-helix repeat-containing protein [Saprospiraceae bacterium]